MTLLAGSLLLRPYVFAFLLAFLASSIRDIGGRRTAVFLAWVWSLAFLAEFSSTRTGIPFGLYHYTQATRGRELFLGDVPFFDSLSFTFLAYAAFCLARVAVPRKGRGYGVSVALLAGVLMMLLDVVIDPLAVRGDRWFLGHVFWYPHGGAYFGVPLSNFAGWLIVGVAGVGGYLMLATRSRPSIRIERPWPGVWLYYGVLGFNLLLTAWIGEWPLLLSGVALHAVLAVALLVTARHSSSPPRASSAPASRSSATAPRSSAGFARANRGGGSEGAVEAPFDDRKGGEAPLRG